MRHRRRCWRRCSSTTRWRRAACAQPGTSKRSDPSTGTPLTVWPTGLPRWPEAGARRSRVASSIGAAAGSRWACLRDPLRVRRSGLPRLPPRLSPDRSSESRPDAGALERVGFWPSRRCADGMASPSPVPARSASGSLIRPLSPCPEHLVVVVAEHPEQPASDAACHTGSDGKPRPWAAGGDVHHQR